MEIILNIYTLLISNSFPPHPLSRDHSNDPTDTEREFTHALACHLAVNPFQYALECSLLIKLISF